MAIQKAKFSIGDMLNINILSSEVLFMMLTLNLIIQKNGISQFQRMSVQEKSALYHLLAENDEITYEAYVSEQNY